MSRFETAAAALAGQIDPDRLRRLATAIEAGQPRLSLTPTVDGGAPVDRLLDTLAADSPPPPVAAAYLRGLADGYEHHAATVRAELVWTGPTTFDVPVRSTTHVLTDLIGAARHELILATYSARPHQSLLAALAQSAARGVSVWIVVETLAGAGSALQGDQPAKAFATLPDIPLFTWTANRRPYGAKMHAKLAVADEQLMLVSSANLTTAGIETNIEAGVLVHGGTAPRRAAEHLRAMRRTGLLTRI
jgi:phosphatidylserine/phosphatidylglycerophosphate/cardiolipin synthase-like enzyme